VADDIVTIVHLVSCACDLCAARAEIERLRVLGNRLYLNLNWHYIYGEYRCDDEYALSDWEEARRG
jgi:hypothetical protein